MWSYPVERVAISRTLAMLSMAVRLTCERMKTDTTDASPGLVDGLSGERLLDEPAVDAREGGTERTVLAGLGLEYDYGSLANHDCGYSSTEQLRVRIRFRWRGGTRQRRPTCFIETTMSALKAPVIAPGRSATL